MKSESPDVQLFVSESKEVQYTSGKLMQKATRTVSWLCVDGALSLSLRISGPDGQVIDEQATDSVYAKDLVIANRVVRILEGLPVLNGNTIREVCVVVAARIIEESETKDLPLEVALEVLGFGRDLSQVLGAQLSDGLLERIQLSMPPDLEPMIRRLQQAGIEFSTRGIRHEVDQGRAEVTPFLRSIGVEREEVLKVRRSRLRDQATDYAPLFMRFLETKQHGTDCQCLEDTMRHAVACLERGVDDMPTMVAMSLYRLAEQKAAALVSVDEVPLFPGASVIFINPNAQASDNPDFDPETTMNKIAGWVGERMSTAPRAIADDVRKLRAKWEKMPITAE